MRLVKYGVADLKNVVKTQLDGHMADMHVVPVLRWIQLLKVICTQKSTREQGAAEREPFLAGTVS